NPNSFDPEPNRLFRNLGDGTFEDVGLPSGVRNADGRSLSATFCDLDGDGWLDLYVNNDVSTNRLYRNLGGDFGPGELVLFDDRSAMTGTADPRGSMGLSVGEVGGMLGEPDGLPDLFITHWIAQENAFYESVVTPRGDLEYRDKTRHLRLGEISIDTVGWGSALVDFDLDGRIDLAVVNGSTLEQKDDPRRLIAEPIFLFWNDGEQFTDVAPVAGDALRRTYWARGLAAADFDGDGDVDLAVSVNRGRPLLLLNETETTHRSLTVRLRAPAAARFGARVAVTAGGRTQYRWYGSDVTFLGMHAPDLIFGLGEQDVAERLEVRWADGNESTLIDVAAGPVDVVQ
ncbi:MAG: CRTAC1 family protein, partial [Phycisphaeraceae bacterium]|nr:CRTAC1 family protein [Phycisphaeraceae bacterium]